MGRKKKAVRSRDALEVEASGGFIGEALLLTPEEADAAIEAEDGFLEARIRRAEEWERSQKGKGGE
mgnify:CR=1 FL=1